MSIKGLMLIGTFLFCAVGALFLPYLGIYGYIADYCISPSRQWWGLPFSAMGIRFSFTLALATFAGIVLQRHNLKFGEKVIYNQETTLLIFLGLIWILFAISVDTIGRYSSIDHPSLKVTKIVIFSLMMTHVITDIRKLNGLFWVFVFVSLILGIKAWETPYNNFLRGRLEGIGGADFAEANFFAAFMASMLPIIGVQFLRSGWYGKILCLISGVFTANAVILCRSRGAFLGLAFGVIAAGLFAPEKHRKTIFIFIFIGLLGTVYLSDSFFTDRILSITVNQEEMDTSSSSRIQLWKAGAKIFIAHPMGIGPGNWYQTIGRYLPEYAGKDSHNTYIKCAVELGVFGISLFMFLLYQAYSNLRSVYKSLDVLPPEEADDFIQYYFAITVSLVVLLACAMTITMIYTEIVWILLMLPVCLKRALDNRLLEMDPNTKLETEP